MSSVLVEKLVKSFDELERCIKLTLDVFEQRDGVPEDVVARVKQYNAIVAKQRELATELERHIDAQNWKEVARLVRVINGLSGMIRDDAQSILSHATGDVVEVAAEREVKIC